MTGAALHSASRYAMRTGENPDSSMRARSPPLPFHVEDGLLLADEVALRELHGAVAATVKHERGVAPEQARGVDPQSQIAAKLRGLDVVPQALPVRAVLLRGRTHISSTTPTP